MASDACPVYSPFFAALGAATSITLANIGASYGTAKSGIGIMAAGVLRPDNMVKSLTPTIMAGILSIYGLVVSIQISASIVAPLPLAESFVYFGAGIAVGLSALASGFSIGIVGDAGVRAFAQQPRLFVAMVLILVFAEVLGLYGMIVALLMISRTSQMQGLC
ncbi:vacuolar ATPase V0 domain subunit c [Lithohypha guttulata]|nr:vacuolar ATPase V0 domain subunit c [Lithohypha guttulata]